MASLASRVTQSLPGLALLNLPVCANSACLRPPTLWQRWWARHEGIQFERAWYCSAECFTSGLLSRVDALALPSTPDRFSQPRFPLGLILLEQGVISEQQLQEALAGQRCGGHGRIGEWLVRAGAATEVEVTNALSLQQNCPVFAKATIESFPETMQFPSLLMRNYGGVPVYFSVAAGTLYLAFAGPLDRSLLRAAGHLMRCRIEPCIVSEAVHDAALARWQAELRGVAVRIEQRQSTREMARAIAGYAEQSRASACAIVRCHDYLWTRLYGDVRTLDLLFRVFRDRAPSPTIGEAYPLALD